MARGPSIRLASSSPEREDGTIRQGDTVAFAIDPPDSGVVTLYGSRDGTILAAWALVRGDLDVVLGPSTAWEASPGPLHVEAALSDLVRHRVRVLASTSFEIAG